MFYQRQQAEQFGEREAEHLKEENADNVEANAGVQDLQTRPKLPSHFVTRDHSIPADVYRFLYSAQTMVHKYPGLSGIFRPGTGIHHDPYDRKGRLFGFDLFSNFGDLGKFFGLPDLNLEGGLSGGNLNLAGGLSGSGLDLGADVSAGKDHVDANVNILGEETSNLIQNILNPGTTNGKNKKGEKKNRMGGIEPCSNADGICQRDRSCGSDGRNIGRCANCVGCGHCCTYEYDDQATTNETIVFFQSPMYPSTRRDSMASSLSIEIRKDVTQVLIEFEDFEMPIGPGPDCLDNDYVEIVSPFDPKGVFGPGNNKLCGLNSGQHIYLTVRPGDLLVLKAVTSGVGFVPLSTSPGANVPFSSGANAYRFRIKVTQIITEYLSNSKFRDGRSSYLDVTTDIPDYYERLKAPRGCLQYFTDTEGTIESFNYDGTARFPNNLKYSICFRTPLNNCGISLQALRFGIGVGNFDCRTGRNQVDAVSDEQCCTFETESAIEKYIGVDGTSDGRTTNSGFATNQLRYFFCGRNFGRTNFVVSSRKGFARVQVFSDENTVASNSLGGNNRDTGFKIKYELNTGIC